MASAGIEVELKFSVGKAKFREVKNKLQAIAKFEGKSEQSDAYFTPKHRNFMRPRFPFEWLSVRRRGNKAILNYKHWHPENAEVTTHCDELETEVGNAGSLEGILSALDFMRLAVVEKEREVFVYGGESEVSLDKVRGLGFFIEIEALKDFGSVEKTKERLFLFARELGLEGLETEKRGYPYLLIKKKGLLKSLGKK